MKRPLNTLTEDEFNKLKASGMLWEIYPEASDTYKNSVTQKKILKYKSFREQLLECLNDGNCISVDCIHCSKPNLICKRHNCYCQSRICRNERAENVKD